MKLLLILKLLAVRCVCMVLGRCMSQRLIRWGVCRELTRIFGSQMDCESIAANWLNQPGNCWQRFVWRWVPGSLFEARMTFCMYAKWLGPGLGQHVCRADLEWFVERGVQLTKPRTLSIDGEPCQIKYKFPELIRPRAGGG